MGLRVSKAQPRSGGGSDIIRCESEVADHLPNSSPVAADTLEEGNGRAAGGGSTNPEPSSPYLAAPAGIRHEVIRTLLALSGPGNVGSFALTCKDLAAEWRSAVRSLPALATYLAARFGGGSAEAAMRHVYAHPPLFRVVLDLGREQNLTPAASLLALAQRLTPPPPPPAAGKGADSTRRTAAEAGAASDNGQAPEAAAAAPAVVAAAAAASDGAVVAEMLQRVPDVLQHFPGCCSQAQLDGLLAEAALAGREGVVRPLLELGGAAVGAALARGWLAAAGGDGGGAGGGGGGDGAARRPAGDGVLGPQGVGRQGFREMGAAQVVALVLRCRGFASRIVL